jgi:tetratricopeptide (TPR) repeat protein
MVLVLYGGSAWSREALAAPDCQALALQPALSSALTKATRHSDDWRSQVDLANAWSDVGCYNEAVAVLQNAATAHPEVAEVQTRLRVAKSLVGEEHFFDDLDRADRQAKAKRDTFRCDSLGDLEACGEAARLEPDNPALLTSFGDALMRAKRPAEALEYYQRAQALATDKQALAGKIRLAEAELPAAPTLAAVSRDSSNSKGLVSASAPPRRYSNVMPDGQSH